MYNKEKVLVGAVCFVTGAAVGFLLTPIKNKICFKSFSCKTFEDSKIGSCLEESDVSNNETSEDEKTE